MVKSRLAVAEGCLPAGDESAIRAEAEIQQSALITRTRIGPQLQCTTNFDRISNVGRRSWDWRAAA